MVASWHFKKQLPGYKVRDPIQGEFFATDAIRNPAEALVREAIQNSLDAALSQTDPVSVRFYLASGEYALRSDEIAPYFERAWAHFQSSQSGLHDPPSETDECPFLVVEDFHTTGLQGDTGQSYEIDGASPNPFFYFFRAEGLSTKSNQERGRWGVGKYVFPRSSRANSFFAVTTRADDKETLLMGQAVLKSHNVRGQQYTPDADFGEANAQGMVMPVNDREYIEKFAATFSLERKGRSGLSVVVPWVDEEITAAALIEAVVRTYFQPILTGNLVVTIATPTGSTLVDHETLRDVAAKFLGRELAADALALIRLAEWGSTCKPDAFFKLKLPPPGAPKWSAALIPPELIERMSEVFEKGEPLAVKVPLTVREKRSADRDSYFDVFLVRDSAADGRPIFIREGVIISDVRGAGTRARGVRSLVTVEDKPLAKLLGDSENPAHTQWQKDSSHFKGKYKHGSSYIEFVRQSVAAIARLLTRREEPDKTLLLDFFSLPTSDEEAPTMRKEEKTRKPGERPDIPGNAESQPRRYRIQKVSGGFAIVRGDSEASLPKVLEVRVSYDVWRGNPFKRWDPADFELGKPPIRFEPAPKGAEIREQSGNRLLVAITDADFRVTVVGFDKNRDVVVDVTPKEEAG